MLKFDLRLPNSTILKLNTQESAHQMLSQLVAGCILHAADAVSALQQLMDFLQSPQLNIRDFKYAYAQQGAADSKFRPVALLTRTATGHGTHVVYGTNGLTTEKEQLEATMPSLRQKGYAIALAAENSPPKWFYSSRITNLTFAVEPDSQPLQLPLALTPVLQLAPSQAGYFLPKSISDHLEMACSGPLSTFITTDRTLPAYLANQNIRLRLRLTTPDATAEGPDVYSMTCAMSTLTPTGDPFALCYELVSHSSEIQEARLTLSNLFQEKLASFVHSYSQWWALHSLHLEYGAPLVHDPQQGCKWNSPVAQGLHVQWSAWFPHQLFVNTEEDSPSFPVILERFRQALLQHQVSQLTC